MVHDARRVYAWRQEATMATSEGIERPDGLVLGLEERPGVAQGLALGFQHVLVSNVWLDPVFVAAVAGLPVALAGNMVNAIFLAAGLVSLLQSTRLVRLPIVEGPSAAFDPLMISFGKAGRLAQATTGILLAGAIVFLLAATGLLGRMRRLFTPAVTGTVTLLVGLALAQFTLTEFLGGNPSGPTFARGDTVAIAATTLLAVLLLSAFGRGVARRYAFVWALLLGDALAALLGRLDLQPVAAAPWLGIPQLLPYGGLAFDLGATTIFLLAFIVAVLEAVAVYHAAGEIVGTAITDRRLNRGVAGAAAGSMVSALFGGFATTAYAQNVGLLRLTGNGSRHAVTYAGGIFLVLAFVPKLGATLAATPDPVVGGIFLPAAGSLIVIGVGLLARMAQTERNLLVVGLAVLLGVGLPLMGAPLFDKLSPGWGLLLSQQIVVGTFVAILLELLLVQLPDRIGYGDRRRDEPTVKGADGDGREQ